MDFRGVTRLFFDPEFDGDPVQADEFDGTEPIEPDDLPGRDDLGDGGDDPEPGGRIVYVIDDVPVEIIRERVQYYDPHGNLITKSFEAYSREKARDEYRTLDEFLGSWTAADRKKEIVVELIRRGVLLDELAEQMGRDYDPFDLVCAVAYDRPPLTRQERARQVEKDDVFSQYGETARAVLQALLDRYADRGIEAIENAADPALGREVLEMEPFSRYGSPMQIVRAFGGRDAYAAAVRNLNQRLYTLH